MRGRNNFYNQFFYGVGADGRRIANPALVSADPIPSPVQEPPRNTGGATTSVGPLMPEISAETSISTESEPRYTIEEISNIADSIRPTEQTVVIPRTIMVSDPVTSAQESETIDGGFGGGFGGGGAAYSEEQAVEEGQARMSMAANNTRKIIIAVLIVVAVWGIWKYYKSTRKKTA